MCVNHRQTKLTLNRLDERAVAQKGRPPQAAAGQTEAHQAVVDGDQLRDGVGGALLVIGSTQRVEAQIEPAQAGAEGEQTGQSAGRKGGARQVEHLQRGQRGEGGEQGVQCLAVQEKVREGDVLQGKVKQVEIEMEHQQEQEQELLQFP